MAPRRVADDLIEANDDTRDPVREREERLLARDDQPEDDAPQGDDQVEDEPQDDQAEDDADPVRGALAGDDTPAPRRRAVREPDDDLTRRIEAAERRAEEAERRAADIAARFEARQSTPVEPPGESMADKQARWALMTPEAIQAEQRDEKVDRALRNHERTLAQATFFSLNAADKATFDTTIAATPALKRYSADVEKKHNEIVQQALRAGQPANSVPSRQDVLKYMLGERALKMASESGKQQTERTQRVARQQTRSVSARSDVAPARRGGQTLEQRLENMAL